MSVKIIYKKTKDHNIYRHTALTIVFVILAFYSILIFFLGLILGFTKTLFSSNSASWFVGLIPIFLSTLIIERLRFILIKNNKISKKNIYIITFLIICIDLLLNTNFKSLTNFYEVFIFICVTLLPIIAQDSLSSFMSYNFGFLPVIVYKLFMNLYLYTLPIMTDLGDYLYSAFNIFIPFTIYMILTKYFKLKREEKTKFYIINSSFFTIPIIIFLIIMIILVSGISNYKMIAIASNSMVPVFSKGDAIIAEKIDINKIKIGDILVFKKENIIVTHRVIKIKEESSKLYFYTKGDANNSPDNNVTKEEEVQGIVVRVVKYIGYPTVWINELFGR